MNETALMCGNLMEGLLPAMGRLPSIVHDTSPVSETLSEENK
jgi:hypothetical protein